MVKIMQRTVNGTKFHYVVNTIDENGVIASELKEIIVDDTNEKRAYKKAVKMVGNFVPVKTEKVKALYKLDDEIFFKYAVKVD